MLRQRVEAIAVMAAGTGGGSGVRRDVLFAGIGLYARQAPAKNERAFKTNDTSNAFHQVHRGEVAANLRTTTTIASASTATTKTSPMATRPRKFFSVKVSVLD